MSSRLTSSITNASERCAGLRLLAAALVRLYNVSRLSCQLLHGCFSESESRRWHRRTTRPCTKGILYYLASPHRLREWRTPRAPYCAHRRLPNASRVADSVARGDAAGDTHRLMQRGPASSLPQDVTSPPVDGVLVYAPDGRPLAPTSIVSAMSADTPMRMCPNMPYAPTRFEAEQPSDNRRSLWILAGR